MTDRTERLHKSPCYMERDDRFPAVLPYLHKFVIVRASSDRSAARARNYRGRVVAVAMGQEGSQDVLCLVLDGPGCEALPVCAFSFTTILKITELPDA